MEIATITATVMGVIMPFVKEGATEFARSVGDKACDKAKQLLDYLKGKLKGDAVAEKDLERFEKQPETFKPALEETLTEKLTADAGFATELDQRLQEMKAEIVVIQNIKKGTDVTGISAGSMAGTTAEVRQTLDEGSNVTGVKITGAITGRS